jgi:DNA-binding transcriptional LysR family regulator
LSVELMLSNRIDDLLHREADIAVRMVPPTQAALVAKRIGGIDVGMHAHQNYLERFGTPKTLQELNGHTLIGYDRENEMIRRLQNRFGAFARSSLAFRADSDLAQLAAIRAGFGIGICQSALAKRDANLVRILPRKFSLALDTWIAMHEDMRGNPRCSVTFSALAEGIAAYLENQ